MQTCSELSHGLGYSDTPSGWTKSETAVPLRHVAERGGCDISRTKWVGLAGRRDGDLGGRAGSQMYTHLLPPQHPHPGAPAEGHHHCRVVL